MPKKSISAKSESLPSLTRRRLLSGAVTAAAAVALPAAAIAAPDTALIELQQTFQATLAAHETAHRHYNHCEKQFFASCPDPPKILTGDGPLGRLVPNDWSWLSAQDLRRLLKDAEQRALWDAARAALPLAKAYEAKTRRVKRASGLAAAEAAQEAAIEALHELSLRIAAVPAHSLASLAVKARIVKIWSAPEWWHDPGPPELLAAQVLDAVMAMACLPGA
jgi:hypothetical protein